MLSLDYAAAIFALLGVYLIGGKNRFGFLFCLASGVVWSIVALKTGVHGLLLEVIPLAVLNVIAFRKWGR